MEIIGIIAFALLVIIALLALIIFFSYTNHKSKLKAEDRLFVPIGQPVNVNGHMMNVYSSDKAGIPLVFISGGGTCSPVLDFKSLYSLLSDKYRVIVVERIGYGFSDVADVDRGIAAVLSDTRQALAASNIEGPFVLCPHSMGGLEALYWAQQYPDEVISIIGLDMGVPETYKDYKTSPRMIKFGEFATSIGLIRRLPQLSESVAIRYGTLTQSEKALYRLIFYRRTSTKPMTNESMQLTANAAIVDSGGTIEVPILIFSSNGEGTGFSQDDWRRFQSDFLSCCISGTMIKLDCPHYVHDFEYEKIAKGINKYIGRL